MRKVLDFYFASLLIVYPIIVVMPKGFDLVSKSWGGMLIIFVFIVMLLKHKYLLKNRFFFSGILIFIPIVISILLSREVSFYKFINAFKFVAPLLFASYIYMYPINKKKLKLIHKILFIYLLLFIGLILYRFSLVNFNLLAATEFKEFIWYEKSHVLAQLYAALSFLFLFLSYKLHHKKTLALIFLLPLFFFGVRSVLLGTVLFLFFMFFKTLLKKFHIIALPLIILLISFSMTEIDFSVLERLVMSAQDANRDASKMTVDSMTSGRTLILQHYVDTFDSEQLFTGSGVQYLDSDALYVTSLHNDLFEFFFSFGLFGLLIMFTSIYYLLFYKIYIVSKGINQRFVLGLAGYWFAVANTAGLLSYQSTVYIYILLFFILTVQIEKTEG